MSYLVFSLVSVSSSAEEGWTDTNAYWEASLLGKAGPMQCILGSSSAEEGWTNNNANWEGLLLRKTGQTPSSSTEEGRTYANAYWELRHQCLPEALLLRKAGPTPMLTGKIPC